MLQLVFDSIDLHDLKGGVSGNWAKLLLGILTLGFDVSLLCIDTVDGTSSLQLLTNRLWVHRFLRLLSFCSIIFILRWILLLKMTMILTVPYIIS